MNNYIEGFKKLEDQVVLEGCRLNRKKILKDYMVALVSIENFSYFHITPRLIFDNKSKLTDCIIPFFEMEDDSNSVPFKAFILIKKGNKYHCMKVQKFSGRYTLKKISCSTFRRRHCEDGIKNCISWSIDDLTQ